MLSKFFIFSYGRKYNLGDKFSAIPLNWRVSLVKAISSAPIKRADPINFDIFKKIYGEAYFLTFSTVECVLRAC